MPVFFITPSQIHDKRVTISGPLCDHLRASLRVTAGEELWVGDDARRRYRIVVESVAPRALIGRVVEEREGPPRPGWRITLGQALLKGERMDWLIQKATELGTAAIVPLVTARTVVRPRPGRLEGQQSRWQAIALEAAQQSERWDLPAVSPPCDAADFFSREAGSIKLILAERAAGQSLFRLPLPSADAGLLVLAVGPEGGWTEAEIGSALANGFLPITLGERILRAETATVAALSVLQSRLGELG